MRYMLMLFHDHAGGAKISASDMEAYMGQMYAYREALIKAGVFVETNGLAPANTACTVRVEGGEVKVHDGPYAETREQLGGYYLISVRDADEARKWASRCPAATWGTIEVRRIVDSRARDE
jgi:hypothetical protein